MGVACYAALGVVLSLCLCLAAGRDAGQWLPTSHRVEHSEGAHQTSQYRQEYGEPDHRGLSVSSMVGEMWGEGEEMWGRGEVRCGGGGGEGGEMWGRGKGRCGGGGRGDVGKGGGGRGRGNVGEGRRGEVWGREMREGGSM